MDGLSALVPAMNILGHVFLKIKTVVNIWAPETSPVLGGRDNWKRYLE